MRVVSFRFLVSLLVVLFAAAGPLAAEEATLEGLWTLDPKASRNLPEAQKGVDVKIEVHGEQLTITRITGQVPIGEPMVLNLDGLRRPQDIAGQKATMSAKWLKRPTKFEHVISLPQAGSVFVTVQTVVTEVSPTGGTLTRTYETRRAKELEYRLLVYRRK